MDSPIDPSIDLRRSPGGLRLALPIVAACWPATAAAHGIGQRFDLPVPLSLYLAGAGATVLFSFVLMAVFARRTEHSASTPGLDLRKFSAARAVTHPLVAAITRGSSIGLLGLLVLAGYFGDDNAFNNIVPVFVWVIFWVGLAYVSGLIGPLWQLVNPWPPVFHALDSITNSITGRRLSLGLSYPDALSTWPAVALLVGFAWLELVWPATDNPRAIAEVILVYSLVTWLGMILFGPGPWLRHGEVFNVFFGFLARFAPLKVASDPDSGDDQWRLLARAPGIGLLADRPLHPSATCFVVLMLAMVTFDGFMSTPLWAESVSALVGSARLQPLFELVHPGGGNVLPLLQSLGLIAFCGMFLALYPAFSWLMRTTLPAEIRNRFSTAELAGLFVLTLIPIALAYHLAHYLSYLLVVGQYLIPLASDPFGFGWDLFGTRLYLVNHDVINPELVWVVSVTAVVGGHVMAVYLAHRTALTWFRDRTAALRSQVPMVTLMVAYTVISLWILAQPIVQAE